MEPAHSSTPQNPRRLQNQKMQRESVRLVLSVEVLVEAAAGAAEAMDCEGCTPGMLTYPLSVIILLYTCPHTTVCVLILLRISPELLLNVSAAFCMCVCIYVCNICVCMYAYAYIRTYMHTRYTYKICLCPPIYVSSHNHVQLLYMCPHTAILRVRVLYICVSTYMDTSINVSPHNRKQLLYMCPYITIPIVRGVRKPPI